MRYLRDRQFIIIIAILLLLVFLTMPYDGIFINHIRQLKNEEGFINYVLSILMPIAKFVGYGVFIAIIAILIWLSGVILISKFLIQKGKVIFLCYIISGITVQVLKHIFGRARPRLTDDIVFIEPSFVGGFDSFPSGHTAVVFCLAYVFSVKYKTLGPIFFAVAIIIAMERVYNLSHFPSDILAGAITGMVTAIVICDKLMTVKREFLGQ